MFRSSHQRCSLRKDVLRNFAKFTGKHLAPRRMQLYLKRDSGAGVFPWIFRNFQEHLFYRRPLVDCFWLFKRWDIREIRKFTWWLMIFTTVQWFTRFNFDYSCKCDRYEYYKKHSPHLITHLYFLTMLQEYWNDVHCLIQYQ